MLVIVCYLAFIILVIIVLINNGEGEKKLSLRVKTNKTTSTRTMRKLVTAPSPLNSHDLHETSGSGDPSTSNHEQLRRQPFDM